MPLNSSFNSNLWDFVGSTDWNVFIGLFAEKWLNSNYHSGKRLTTTDRLFYCESCGEGSGASKSGGEGTTTPNTNRASSSAHAGSSGSQGAPTASLSKNIKNFFRSGKSKKDKGAGASDSLTSPDSTALHVGASDGGTRDEDAPLPITPRDSDKEIFLCTTCCRCFCKSHAKNHNYSLNTAPSALNVPHGTLQTIMNAYNNNNSKHANNNNNNNSSSDGMPGTEGNAKSNDRKATAPKACSPLSEDDMMSICNYPQRHSFFISVPYHISTHPEHVCYASESGLQFPCVFINEIEEVEAHLLQEVRQTQLKRLQLQSSPLSSPSAPNGAVHKDPNEGFDDDSVSVSAAPLWLFYRDFFSHVADRCYEQAITLPANRSANVSISATNAYYTSSMGTGSSSPSGGGGGTSPRNGNRELETMPQFYFSPCLKVVKPAAPSTAATSSRSPGLMSPLKKQAPTSLNTAASAAAPSTPQYTNSTWSFRFFNASNGVSKTITSEEYEYKPAAPHSTTPESVLRQLGQLMTILVYLRRRGARLAFPDSYNIYRELLAEAKNAGSAGAGHNMSDATRVGKSTEMIHTKTLSGCDNSTAVGDKISTARSFSSLYRRDQTDKLMLHAGICGFDNPSVFCYLNSVLQCVLRCKYFCHPLMKMRAPQDSPGAVTTAFVQLAQQLWHQSIDDVRSHAASYYVRKLYKNICRSSKIAELTFGTEQQQDAQELLLCLLNGIADEFDSDYKKKLSAAAAAKEGVNAKCKDRISFEGALNMERTCLTCGATAVRKENFMSLSIPVKDTMEEGLASLFESVELKEKERYACENCFSKLSREEQLKSDELAKQQQKEREVLRKEGKKIPAAMEANPKGQGAVYQIAEESTRISALGGTLAVHLLRFQYDKDEQDFIKTNKFVKIAFTLDLGEYVTDEVLLGLTRTRHLSRLAAQFPSVKDAAVLEDVYFHKAEENVQKAAQLLVESGHEKVDAAGSKKPSLGGTNGSTSDLTMRTATTVMQAHSRTGSALGGTYRSLSASTTSPPPPTVFDPFGLSKCSEHGAAMGGVGCALKPPSTKRRLVGLVTHRGSLHGGHYISYVRDLAAPDVWFRCDDETVDITNEEEIVSCGAEIYLAFYE